jgi:hypothetical protein
LFSKFIISDEFEKRDFPLSEKLKHREFVFYDNNLRDLSGKIIWILDFGFWILDLLSRSQA